MKLRCPKCKKVFVRDAREKVFKLFMTKRGYKSMCDATGKDAFCKPVK